jgi:diguanylate cyclase (GGDEF)-like protein
VRLAFEAAAIEVGERRLAATVSVGAASGAAMSDIEQLIGNADAALYRAKLNGRNRVEMAGTDGTPTGLAPAPGVRKAA